jgi:hypothetical protein
MAHGGESNCILLRSFRRHWIATHKKDLSPEEIQQRFAASLRGS